MGIFICIHGKINRAWKPVSARTGKALLAFRLSMPFLLFKEVQHDTQKPNCKA